LNPLFPNQPFSQPILPERRSFYKVCIVGNRNHSAKRKEVKKAAMLPEHISNTENACLG
jgi:hypothetical protein